MKSFNGFNSAGNLDVQGRGVTYSSGAVSVNNLSNQGSLYATQGVTVRENANLGGSVIARDAINFGRTNLLSDAAVASVNGVSSLGYVEGGANSLTLYAGSGENTMGGFNSTGDLLIGGAGSVVSSGAITARNFLAGSNVTTTNGGINVSSLANINADVTSAGAINFANTELGRSSLITTQNNRAISLGTITSNDFDLTLSSGMGTKSFNGFNSAGNLNLQGIGASYSTGGISVNNFSNQGGLTLTDGITVRGNANLGGNVIAQDAIDFGRTNLLSEIMLISRNSGISLGNVDSGNNGLILIANDNSLMNGFSSTRYLRVAGGGALVSDGAISVRNLYAEGNLTTTSGGINVSGEADLGANVSSAGAVQFGNTYLNQNTTIVTNNQNIALGTINSNDFDLSLQSGIGMKSFNGFNSAGNLDVQGRGVTYSSGAVSVNNLTNQGSLYATQGVTVRESANLGGSVIARDAINFGRTNLLSDAAVASVNGVSSIGYVNGGANSLTLYAGSGENTMSGFNSTGDLLIGGAGSVVSSGAITARNFLAGSNVTTTNGGINVSSLANINADVSSAGAINFANTELGRSSSIATQDNALSLGRITSNQFDLTLASGTGTKTFDGFNSAGNLNLMGAGASFSNGDIAVGNLTTQGQLIATSGGINANQNANLGGLVQAEGAISFGSTEINQNTAIITNNQNIGLGTIRSNNFDLALRSGVGGKSFNGFNSGGALHLLGAGATTSNGEIAVGSLITQGQIATTSGGINVSQNASLGGDVQSAGAVQFGSTDLNRNSAIITNNQNIGLGTINSNDNDLSLQSGTGTKTFDGFNSAGNLYLMGAGPSFSNGDIAVGNLLTQGQLIATSGGINANQNANLGGLVQAEGAISFGSTDINQNTAIITNNQNIGLGTIRSNNFDLALRSGVGEKSFNGFNSGGSLHLLGAGNTISTGAINSRNLITQSGLTINDGGINVAENSNLGGNVTSAREINLNNVSLDTNITLAANSNGVNLGVVRGANNNLTIESNNGVINIGTIGSGEGALGAVVLNAGDLGNVTIQTAWAQNYDITGNNITTTNRLTQVGDGENSIKTSDNGQFVGQVNLASLKFTGKRALFTNSLVKNFADERAIFDNPPLSVQNANGFDYQNSTYNGIKWYRNNVKIIPQEEIKIPLDVAINPVTPTGANVPINNTPAPIVSVVRINSAPTNVPNLNLADIGSFAVVDLTLSAPIPSRGAILLQENEELTQATIQAE